MSGFPTTSGQAQGQSSAAAASHGSQTCLVTEDAEVAEEAAPAPAPAANAPPLVLRLNPRPHISFTEDTVDNERVRRRQLLFCAPF